MSAPRVICPRCRRDVAVTPHGNLHHHATIARRDQRPGRIHRDLHTCLASGSPAPMFGDRPIVTAQAAGGLL